MKFLLTLFFLVAPVHALPHSHTPPVAAEKVYIPLVVVCISLFFLLVTIKLVYMKHRRIWTVHAPPRSDRFSCSTSGFGLRDKETGWDRGLFVGCLGSPVWETSLTAGLRGATYRRQGERASFVNLRDTLAMRSTRSTSERAKSLTLAHCSVGVDQAVLPLSSCSQIAAAHGSRSSRSLGSWQDTSTLWNVCCSDYGEFRRARLTEHCTAKGTRRAIPCSIRLVDGPGHSNQVKYMFLSGAPPITVMESRLTSARDSFQLSQCSFKHHHEPIPPLPSTLFHPSRFKSPVVLPSAIKTI